MDAVQAITGRGGWPMTVFLAPDGRPVLRRHLLPEAVVPAAAGGGRRRVAQPARRAARPGRQAHRGPRSHGAARPGRRRARRRAPRRGARGSWRQQFDAEWGGFGGAPKFPQTMSLELVLRAHRSSGSADALRRRDDQPRRHGVGRHLRPPRRRLRPLLGRPPVAGAALREDALRPGPAGAGLPPRLAGHRRAALPPGRRRDGRPTCCATSRQPDGGFSSAEDADSPGPDGHNEEGRFYDLDAGGDRRRPRRRRARRPPPSSGTASPRTATSRAAPSCTGPSAATCCARRPSRRPARRLFEARERRPRPGPRRQGAHRVERARWWRPWPRPAPPPATSRLGRRRPPDGRVPAGRAARRRRAAGGARGSADAGARHDALAADHAALVARLRRAWPRPPARPAGSSRRCRPPTCCSTGSGTPSGGGLFTTADDGEALVVRQKDLLDSATPSANSLAAVALYRLGGADRRAALPPPRRPDPAARRPASSASAPSAFSHLLAAVDLRRGRRHRDRRRRRPPRPRGRRAPPLPARRRAGVGRAATSRRCGRAAATASPTCATTTSARRRSTP